MPILGGTQQVTRSVSGSSGRPPSLTGSVEHPITSTEGGVATAPAINSSSSSGTRRTLAPSLSLAPSASLAPGASERRGPASGSSTVSVGGLLSGDG